MLNKAKSFAFPLILCRTCRFHTYSLTPFTIRASCSIMFLVYTIWALAMLQCTGIWKMKVISERTKELVLISDGCPGQNKNKTMVHFLFSIVHVLKLFKKGTYLFPVRGHSYLTNDQDFSLISAQKKNTTIAEIPEVWDEKILKAQKKPFPFVLKILTHRDFKDIKKSTEKMLFENTKATF